MTYISIFRRRTKQSQTCIKARGPQQGLGASSQAAPVGSENLERIMLQCSSERERERHGSALATPCAKAGLLLPVNSRPLIDQRWLLPASQGGPGSGVQMPLWLLPVPHASSHLQIHGVLEHPEDPRPKDCQEGRMQRLEGSEGGHGRAEGRSRWQPRSS